MRITTTNGNNANGISGSQVSIYLDNGKCIDSFNVPKHDGINYCTSYKGGEYGKRFIEAIKEALIIEPIDLKPIISHFRRKQIKETFNDLFNTPKKSLCNMAYSYWIRIIKDIT